MNDKYEPNLKSLRKHKLPDWFDDAKLGIFIHWGLPSVPAFAPAGIGDIFQVIKDLGFKGHFKNNPYAEWYLNTLRIDGSPTQKYHRENYGENFSYDDFVPEFNKAIQNWDPDYWADLFKSIGAGYVVLVTKHHDGFLLWPSSISHPIKKNYFASRDIVGELTKAVKSRGMKMGVYYSGTLDWSIAPNPITDPVSMVDNGPADKEYAKYADGHFRELVDRYEPEILWNDIGYPPQGKVFDLFAYFYNKTPDGVVNDRWIQLPVWIRNFIKIWPVRNIVSWAARQVIMRKGLVNQPPPHSDYSTPEYTTLDKISRRKWECTRGIGMSFGYNRMEGSGDYLKSHELVRMFVDIVSKNGNLLLNLGPKPDGSIPTEQLECVSGLGEWLKINGSAIYGTRPWIKADSTTKCNVDVRYTRKGDTLYSILMDTPKENEVVINNLEVVSHTTIKLLGHNTEVNWEQVGQDLKISLPDNLLESPAYALEISPLPSMV